MDDYADMVAEEVACALGRSRAAPAPPPEPAYQPVGSFDTTILRVTARQLEQAAGATSGQVWLHATQPSHVSFPQARDDSQGFQ